MSCASLTSLTERAGLNELKRTAGRNRDGTIDADVIAAAPGDADNTINGYVGAKYSLPLPSAPKIVRTWAVPIARYMLFRDGAPDYVRTDYDDTIAALKDVAAGRIALPVAPGEEKPPDQAGRVMASHPPAVFTPQKLLGGLML